MLSSLPPHPIIERCRDIRQANVFWWAIARRTRAMSRRLHEQAHQLIVCSQELVQQQNLVRSCVREHTQRPDTGGESPSKF